MADLFPNFSVRELARCAGISPTTASRIKRGGKPDPATLEKLQPYASHCLTCGTPLPIPDDAKEAIAAARWHWRKENKTDG